MLDSLSVSGPAQHLTKGWTCSELVMCVLPFLPPLAGRRNVGIVDRLALVMPGGCAVIGVNNGKKVAQATAQQVDVFDSTRGESRSWP